MARVEHTPGPWFAVNDGTADEPMMVVKAARISGKPPRHEVAIVATGDSSQEMENANARLIAAAPDLLSAAQNALNYMRLHKYADQSWADDLEAAIAKATGETP